MFNRRIYLPPLIYPHEYLDIAVVADFAFLITTFDQKKFIPID
jgi:hypothetical protein